MPIVQRLLRLYRGTAKRLHPVHRVLYFVGERVVVPQLERILQLKTPPDDPLSFRIALLTRTWEPETLSALRRLVSPGDVVLDVGAHVGYYVRVLSELVGPTGRVYAFEPQPSTFRLLEQNTAKLRNVELLECAASDRDGVASLYDEAIDSGGVSLGSDVEGWALRRSALSDELVPRLNRETAATEYHVRTVRIDSLVEREKIAAVRLVKLDVEGAEHVALLGMEALLRRPEELAIVFELNPGALTRCGATPKEVCDLLRGCGFQLTLLDSDSGPVPDTLELESSYVNVIAQRGVDVSGPHSE